LCGGETDSPMALPTSTLFLAVSSSLKTKKPRGIGTFVVHTFLVAMNLSLKFLDEAYPPVSPAISRSYIEPFDQSIKKSESSKKCKLIK